MFVPFIVKHTESAVIALWTVLITISMGWGIHQEYNQSIKLAKNTARANFDKDQAFRKWATSHGGVYVPVDMKRTPPSPWLSHIPDRDITTRSGKKLTLMNPAYMLRQMMDEYPGLYRSQGHITSLKLLNPNNKPDAWETQSLKRFENGEQEAFELTQIDGKPYMRLMRPMVVKSGCIKCHSQQNYNVGDIRGGVSVSVPMEPFYESSYSSIRTILITHLLFWLLGVFVFHYLFKKRNEHIKILAHAHAELETMAKYDKLTGLPNRNMLLERLEQEMAKTKRNGDILALLFFDLDNFKSINDTKGHVFGDALLREVARRLEENLRESDLIGRLGGDEFVLIADGFDKILQVEQLVEKIFALFSNPFLIDEHEIFISLSIGISLYPQDTDNMMDLIKNADTAMYRAKSSGKSTYRFYTERYNYELREWVSLQDDLRKALEKNEFHLVFQPQLSSDAKRIAGLEALIRWRHTTRGVVSPNVFIPIAEESGLIEKIGTWVMKEAFSIGNEWYRQGLLNAPVAVNVSARQLRNPNFVDILKNILDLTGLPRKLAKIEVTESLLMENLEENIGKLHAIHDLGITIALDDFGTGYSSLAYLKRFPVDEVKIDQSFVRDIPENSEDMAIVKAILAMAKTLGMDVVAEGVETDTQHEFLASNGCNKLQGYLFSKPLDTNKMKEFLMNRKGI